MTTPHFDTIALIGIGLIGSSISHATRRGAVAASGNGNADRSPLARRIVGYAKTARTRETALRLKLIDEAFETAADAARGADLVILCVPVGACGPVAEEIKGVLKPGAILTDVGSVKGAIVRDVLPHVPPGVHFVPGHPIAGTEHSGPESGFAELYDGRWCILTPLPGGASDAHMASARSSSGASDAHMASARSSSGASDAHMASAQATSASDYAVATEKLAAFWRALGSNVEIMDPDHHDMVLGITSHVPHLIAFNIVNTARHLERVTDSEVIKFSAGGFRDFTRIAASDPTMWRDVFLNNREAVLEMLGRFTEDLVHLQRCIRYGDGDELFKQFAEARGIRRGIIQAGQDTAAPDFGRPHGPEAKK